MWGWSCESDKERAFSMLSNDVSSHRENYKEILEHIDEALSLAIESKKIGPFPDSKQLNQKQLFYTCNEQLTYTPVENLQDPKITFSTNLCVNFGVVYCTKITTGSWNPLEEKSIKDEKKFKDDITFVTTEEKGASDHPHSLEKIQYFLSKTIESENLLRAEKEQRLPFCNNAPEGLEY